jgi:hypothetical protein
MIRAIVLAMLSLPFAASLAIAQGNDLQHWADQMNQQQRGTRVIAECALCLEGCRAPWPFTSGAWALPARRNNVLSLGPFCSGAFTVRTSPDVGLCCTRQ